MNNKIQKGLVSIIIPCFNTAQYLPQAIESVLNQTYSNLEIIVIDDGSTDNTKNVIKPFLNDIMYIYKDNGGPASARNLGITSSRGEFIAFLDADDYWLPEKLTNQVSFLMKNPQFDMVHSNLLISRKDRELYSPILKNKVPSGKVFSELFLDNHIYNLTVIIRRICFLKTGGLDENKKLIGIEDYDFWLRIALLFKIGFINKIVAVYNIHDNNLSNEINIILSQQYLIQKFSKNNKVIQEYPGIIKEKKERLSFRLACWLIEKKEYKSAFKYFLISSRRSYLKFHSLIGILCCILNSNSLFKSRTKALDYKKYGLYHLKNNNYKLAKSYLKKSLKNYPLQKILLTYLVIFFK
jgi:glycosyltransferase involved in cell wall biosynthesis